MAAASMGRLAVTIIQSSKAVEGAAWTARVGLLLSLRGGLLDLVTYTMAEAARRYNMSLKSFPTIKEGSMS